MQARKAAPEALLPEAAPPARKAPVERPPPEAAVSPPARGARGPALAPSPRAAAHEARRSRAAGSPAKGHGCSRATPRQGAASCQGRVATAPAASLRRSAQFPCERRPQRGPPQAQQPRQRQRCPLPWEWAPLRFLEAQREARSLEAMARKRVAVARKLEASIPPQVAASVAAAALGPAMPRARMGPAASGLEAPEAPALK
mmetsp:Transcript_92926/g.207569  ORF Transcript_92926/g.207569 Transcript_92926/m.207569 type:complete len:201 (-) Transcript_92926:425-1027(-)